MSDVARELGVGSPLPWRRPRAGPRRLAVAVHAQRQRKALGDQVLRDAVAHQADADEADPRFAHVATLRVAPLHARDFGCMSAVIGR